MTDTKSTLALHLKKAGYSVTKPRQDVFNLLAAGAPLTMHTLWKKLEPSTDRSSIYRTITLFEKLGIVQRISHGWKYTLELTDDFVPHHHHFTCTNCHIMISFDEPKSFSVILETVANDSGFVPTGHTLEIEGLCSNCRVNV